MHGAPGRTDGTMQSSAERPRKACWCHFESPAGSLPQSVVAGRTGKQQIGQKGAKGCRKAKGAIAKAKNMSCKKGAKEPKEAKWGKKAKWEATRDSKQATQRGKGGKRSRKRQGKERNAQLKEDVHGRDKRGTSRRRSLPPVRLSRLRRASRRVRPHSMPRGKVTTW